MRTAIVGGGATGLTCAYLLAKGGVPVTIFERGEGEGGLGATFRKDGFAFDFGPHEFCTNNPELETLLRDLCGDDLLVIEKHVAQYFNGKYVRYPLEVVDVLRNVGPWLCGRSVLEVAWSQLRNRLMKPQDDSFESWTTARFGRTLYEMYFGPYSRKVWGVEPSELDPRTAAQRISVDSVWDLIKKMVAFELLGSEDFKRSHSEFRRSFFYVKRGFGSLHAHLRRRIEELGGRFEFGKQLCGVRRRNGEAVGLDFADGTREEDFTHVISTIPLPRLVQMTLGERGTRLVHRNQLPFRGMIFVFLRIDRPAVLDYHWTYYPDPAIPFQRLTEFTHFGAQMSPAGQTGLVAEVAANPGDSLWELDDAEISGRCIANLEHLGVIQRHELIGVDVMRNPFSYPLQVHDFIEKADTLLSALQEVPNLVSLGRQGLFRYCNTNECMEMAMDVVPRLLAGQSSIRFEAQPSWQGVGLTDRYVSPATLSG